MNRSPHVFISYSHDSPEHCDRVLELAQQLRRDGIEAELDQFHQQELLHWPRWCEEQLRPDRSDFVLCVCTGEYKRRIEGQAPADVGKGVFWEGTLIYNAIYASKGNGRFVPITLDRAKTGDFPSALAGYDRFHLDAFCLDQAESDYAKLYRLLTRQVGVTKTQVGEIRPLPPLSSPGRKTDFAQLVLARIGAIGSDTRKILAILEQQLLPPSTPDRPHNLPPWMPPEYFIGRSSELRALCDGLTGPGGGALAVVQPQVIRGAGGIGKTRLAIQAAWVLYLQGQCDMAFYVSASSPDELDAQLAALSGRSLLDIYGNAEPPRELEARCDDVIHALRRHAGRWILLLDAADSEEAREAVKTILQGLAGGRFLVTSRREDWPKALVHKVPLDVFTPEEARACLRSRYWKAERIAQEIADLDRVAAVLGHLPLALALAASYMESRRITPARYLELWESQKDILLGYSTPDVDYDRSLLVAFELSHRQLDPSSAALLHLLAWLAPEPFPRHLVEGPRLQDFLAVALEGPKRMEPSDALALLKALSLIQLDEESLRFHRLVLECARAAMSEADRLDSFSAVVAWLAASLPLAEFDKASWELWTQLSPHLDAVLDAAERMNTGPTTVGQVADLYGNWLYGQARYRVAEPLMRRTLSIKEDSLGPSHPAVADSLLSLALLLNDTGRRAEAEPLVRRALATYETSFGPEHANVAITLSNLASLLQMTHRQAEAEPLMRRALAIHERSLGPEHPKVAIRLNELAMLLHATNRFAEAELLLRRALTINENTYGPEHPTIAAALNNFAELLQATNRLTEAEPLLRRALVIVLKFTVAVGHLHPHLGTALLNYEHLLEAMSFAAPEIAQRIHEAAADAGLDAESLLALSAQLFLSSD